MIEEPQVVVHEGDESGASADLLDSDGLTSKGFAKADRFPIDAEPVAAGAHNFCRGRDTQGRRFRCTDDVRADWARPVFSSGGLDEGARG